MKHLERFDSLQWIRGANDRLIELRRHAAEVVYLAFDPQIDRFVELHEIPSNRLLSAEEKNAARERLESARDLPSRSFQRVLDHRESEDDLLYLTNLNDGERLDEYLRRMGALPPAIAFSLGLNLLDDLLSLQPQHGLLEGVGLGCLRVCLLEKALLSLRVVDVGFARRRSEGDEPVGGSRLVHEFCGLLFLLLTGQRHAGEDCDRFKVLTSLPMSLRILIRSTLAHANAKSATLERLREALMEALRTSTRDGGRRAIRRHVEIGDAFVPRSALRSLLLADLSLPDILRDSLVLEEDMECHRHPFSFRASDVRTAGPVTLHLLPAWENAFEPHAVSCRSQRGGFQSGPQDHLLRQLSVWRSADLVFLAEEGLEGIPLSQLMAGRGCLNPPEVRILLREIALGLEQVKDCGMHALSLHPSQILLRPAGSNLPRDLDKLLQRRLDAWPVFVAMLRPFVALGTLCDPLILCQKEGREEDSNEFFNRYFVALAAYLLSGEDPYRGPPSFPESMSSDLAEYVTRALTGVDSAGRALPVREFLAAFDCWAAPVEAMEKQAGAARLAARMHRAIVPHEWSEAPESAGSISDFDEEAVHEEACSPVNLHQRAVLGRGKIRSKSMGILAWAAGLPVCGCLAFALLQGRSSEVKAPRSTNPRVGAVSSVAPSTAAAPSSQTPVPPAPAAPKSVENPIPSMEIRRAELPAGDVRAILKLKGGRPEDS